MPVSGNEIASLDFANLIGGPLDAIVRAQAKSAIATTNFIKEVGFDKNGKIINANFDYTRREEDGGLRQFSLTVPFLTMIPVPYLTVSDALVEFNAKISSTTQNEEETHEESSAEFQTKISFWFFSVSVSGKTASTKNTSRSDKEERSFDMKVLVRAKNQELPAGTERLLTLLEQSLRETKGSELIPFNVLQVTDAPTRKKILIETENAKDLADAVTKAGATNPLTFTSPDPTSTKDAPKEDRKFKITLLEADPSGQDTKHRAVLTLDPGLNDDKDPLLGATVEVKVA